MNDSISQASPDFRNLGVLFRLLLLANMGGIAAALAAAPDLADFAGRFLEGAVILEPAALTTAALLAAAAPLLRRAGFVRAALAGALLAAGTALALTALANQYLYVDAPRDLPRTAALALLLSAGIAVYFHLRGRAATPIMAHTRLMALQARIRPHFLFNTLNAAVGLIRGRPDQAEEALLSLADLFHAALKDPAELATLEEEIELARSYLEIEALRLGERLRVEWDVAEEALPNRLPRLTLQPLVENAVYHGIEPRPEGGCIHIRAWTDTREVTIDIDNPLPQSPREGSGHALALGNVAERLDLAFDAEASLTGRREGELFHVRIILPKTI